MSCLLHQDHENPVKTWFYRIHAANDASRDRWEMQETDMIGFLPNRGLTGEMSPPCQLVACTPWVAIWYCWLPLKISNQNRRFSVFLLWLKIYWKTYFLYPTSNLTRCRMASSSFGKTLPLSFTFLTHQSRLLTWSDKATLASFSSQCHFKRIAFDSGRFRTAQHHSSLSVIAGRTQYNSRPMPCART